MDYSNLTTALGGLMVVPITNPASATPSSDTNFNNILPNIINDAEQRIYREIDFLRTRQSVTSNGFKANSRNVTLPTGTIVLQGANTMTALSVLADSDDSNPPTFIATENSSLLTIVDLQGIPTPTGLPDIGSWINVVTTIPTINRNHVPPQVQGYYQVVGYDNFNGGFTVDVGAVAPFSGTDFGTAANFTTTQGSAEVQVAMTNHGFSIGSIFTVGIASSGDAITTIPAGNYVVTSIPDSNDFTFNLPFNAPSSMNVNENNNIPHFQYLTNPVIGSRNRLEIMSKDAFDIIWPEDGAGTQGTPKYGTLLDDQTLLVGPTPINSFLGEFTGIFRPAPISATNTSTYLSTTYPDLFLAACMVFGMLYQKDADQPQGAPPGMDAQKWEQVYEMRKSSVMDEIARQKGQSQNWSNYQQTPLSTPVRP